MNNKIMVAAREYLAAGYSIIPVGADKVPLIKWKKYQSQKPTLEEVEHWCSQFPEMQIGIVTGTVSGLAVIDIEKGGDRAPFPETLTASTGGEGLHLYYKHPGSTVPNGIRIAELVDVRGDGGFVVAPPSRSVKGQYTWLSDPTNTELALYPVDIMMSMVQPAAENLIPTGERNIAATKKVGELLAALPDPDSRAEVWAQLEHWNQTAVAEPLSEAELKKVFDSVTARHDKTAAADTLVLKPFTLQELYEQEFPPIKWLAQDLFPVGMMAAITGESNCYKSFLTLALAQSVATGTPFLGHFGIEQPGKVLIIDEENNRRLIEKRFKDMGVGAHENIVFLSQSGIQLDQRTHLDTLMRVVEEIDPVLVVLDSLVRFHGKDENSASEMRQVMKVIGSMVTDKRSVVFIHHHKKEGFGSNSGSNSVRGSTDIFNALDCHIGVKRNTDSLTVKQYKLRVQEELPAFTVGVDSLTSDYLKFTYQGEDTSRQDLLNETMNQIKVMLYEAAGEVISRKEFTEAIDVSKKMLTEALNTLVEKEEISRTRGAHNTHLYSIGGPQEEAPDTDGEIEENTKEIPY